MWGNADFSESECSSIELEGEELTTLHYQTGRVEVGDKDEDGEESMRFSVEFVSLIFCKIPCCFNPNYGETRKKSKLNLVLF